MSEGDAFSQMRDSSGDETRMDQRETADERALDPEEYTQKRRLRDIFDARARVGQTDHDAILLKMNPEYPGFGEYEHREALLSASQAFIQQVETLMVQIYPETGQEYWGEVELGTVTIEPPEDMTKQVKPTVHNGNRRVEEPAETHTVEFRGVNSVLNTEVTVSHEFSATIRQDHRGTFTENRVVGELIPRQIPKKACRQASMFLGEIGLDVDPDDSRPMNHMSWEQ